MDLQQNMARKVKDNNNNELSQFYGFETGKTKIAFCDLCYNILMHL